ncbi:MAG: hypothetical protein AB7O97_18220 [Planctomycetota bacterium]
MSDAAPNLTRPVLIAATVTLVVSVLRLVGELQGWSAALFGVHEPGTAPQPGMLGIWVLVPIFGFWFGRRLRQRTGGPPHAGKAALWFAIGIAVVAGGFAALVTSGLVPFGTEEAPEVAAGLQYILIVDAIAAAVLVFAWPRLAGVLALYGVLARIPVVAITWLALENGWHTHHVLLPPGIVLPEGTSQFAFLATPQLTVWILFTMGIGGLAGCLGAATAGRRG